MTTRTATTLRRSAAIAAIMLAAALPVHAQGGPTAPGQGGLSPDTPTIAPQPPGASTGAEGYRPGPAGGAAGQPPAAAQGGDTPKPRTPLPPRDTPRAPQPGQATSGDGPKTALPPRDTPRAQQPGQRTAAVDPDWPCVQVKVPNLSYGQMWGGPELDEAFRTWRDDEEVEDLVEVIAARRTKIEEAKTAIARFAKTARASGENPDLKLSRLFAGAFDEINRQRNHIMIGIQRYSRKQRELSERIKAESLRIAETQKDMASQNTPEALKQQEALNWDTRIYDERARSLTYVCESPVLLEQRAFDLGREIQAHLSQSAR